MRILLIEDDESLGKGMRKGLMQDGYAVDWMRDGFQAEKVLKTEQFDLIILDLGLPNLPGLTLLQNLRDRGDITPVLILTAHDSIEERIQGLDSGADDYLTKPFDLNELLARLRALQRRLVSRAIPVIEYKNLILDPAAHTVMMDGEPLILTRREFSLLHLLLDNTGRVLSRERLTQSLYGWGEEVDSNALEVHVHNLRKRFTQDIIQTVRGVGYVIPTIPQSNPNTHD